jgi:hypothetical protein
MSSLGKRIHAVEPLLCRDLRPATRKGRPAGPADSSPNEYHAEVVPGVSVRIFGLVVSGSEPDGLRPWVLGAGLAMERAREFLKALPEGRARQLACLVDERSRGQCPAGVVQDWLDEHGAPGCFPAGDLFAQTGYRQILTEFDRTFAVGDQAEFDSYNLSYYGPIVGIGRATVTVQKGYTRTHDRARLDLYRFAWRNWNFDVNRVARENAAEMQNL